MGLDSTGSSPVFPNMILNSYTYFLNQLKVTSSQKKLYFDVRITTKTRTLASLLVRLNVIRRFHILNREVYRVYPAYTRFRKYTRPIKGFTRSNGRHRFKLQTLQVLNLNTPNTYYILETTQGLMTHKEAIRLKLGGLLLLVVY